MIASRSGTGPVCVVGAGPSGLAAAITLAREGLPVTVHEKRKSVGQRFHGDFQGLESWSREEDVLDSIQRMGFQTNFHTRPCRVSTYYDDRGRPHIVRTERPLFYLVRRGGVPGSLDLGLYKQALEAGVEVRFNSTVKHTDGPTIIATGPRAGDAIVVGYLFQTDMEDTVIAKVSQRIAPRGYSYLLVSEGQATLASCQFGKMNRWKESLDATVRDFQRIRSFDLSGARFFSGHGNVLANPRLREGNRWFVGEAAGLQDALWGFGLRYAITSGYLAAQDILGGTPYEDLVARELFPHHRAGIVNRVLWEALGDRAFPWFVDQVARRPDPVAFMGRGLGPLSVKLKAHRLARKYLSWRGRLRGVEH